MRAGAIHRAGRPHDAGSLRAEDRHRIFRQALQEVDDVEVLDQRVRQSHERTSQQALAPRRSVISALSISAVRSFHARADSPAISLIEPHPPCDNILSNVIDRASALESCCPQPRKRIDGALI